MATNLTYGEAKKLANLIWQGVYLVENELPKGWKVRLHSPTGMVAWISPDGRLAYAYGKEFDASRYLEHLAYGNPSEYREHDGIRVIRGPGKFEGEMLISELLMEMLSPDDEAGDPSSVGWAGLWRGNLRKDLVETAKANNTPLTREEEDFVDEQVGAIAFERTDGFVEVEWFDNENKLEKAWEQLSNDLAVEDEYE